MLKNIVNDVGYTYILTENLNVTAYQNVGPSAAAGKHTGIIYKGKIHPSNSKEAV